MPLLLLIVLGACAGYLATRLMKVDLDPLTTIAIGAVGALLGGLMLQGVFAILGLLGGLIGAVLGACLVLWLYQAVRGRK